MLDCNYVILEDENDAAASPEKTKVLSIAQFVKEKGIDMLESLKYLQ